jgi:cephalosporin hydroxylase
MAAKFSAQDLYGVDPYEGFPLDQWPERLHGWFSDAPVFEEVISKVRPDLIIEVGSWLGASAIHMAGLLKKHGLDESKIVCVDTWLGAVEFWGDHADETRYGLLLERDDRVSQALVQHVRDELLLHLR